MVAIGGTAAHRWAMSMTLTTSRIVHAPAAGIHAMWAFAVSAGRAIRHAWTAGNPELLEQGTDRARLEATRYRMGGFGGS